MTIVVQKFGGSSVANPERIRRVSERILQTAEAGNQVVVILSAMGDTTDDLIELAAQLSTNPCKREMDMLLSTGEQQSVALMAMLLCDMGYPAVSLTGPQAGYKTDGVYSKARIIDIDTKRVLSELNDGKIVVVTGFQGLAPNGDITTLGRGGSDTSAVAMAVALKADICEIYTDVDGVYTADPRVVKKAWKIPEISYDEMLDMAAMGALVLQPRSVEVAKQNGIPLCVRSSFNQNEGTIVKEVANVFKELEKDLVVCGVAHDMNVLKVNLYGIPDQPGVADLIFSSLANEKINLDMIIQSGRGTPGEKQNLSFTTGKDDAWKVKSVMNAVVKELGAEGFDTRDDVAKISLVGAGMITRPGVAANMFHVLADNNINIHMISTSEIKISCIVDADRIKDAAIALHTAFGLDRD